MGDCGGCLEICCTLGICARGSGNLSAEVKSDALACVAIFFYRRLKILLICLTKRTNHFMVMPNKLFVYCVGIRRGICPGVRQAQVVCFYACRSYFIEQLPACPNGFCEASDRGLWIPCKGELTVCSWRCSAEMRNLP